MVGIVRAEKDVGGAGVKFSSLQQCEEVTKLINNQLPGRKATWKQWQRLKPDTQST